MIHIVYEIQCDDTKFICKRCDNWTFLDLCQYVFHVKIMKEQMIQKIQHLQRKIKYLEEENKLKKNIWTEQIICLLNADQEYNEIISWLQ